MNHTPLFSEVCHQLKSLRLIMLCPFDSDQSHFCSLCTQARIHPLRSQFLRNNPFRIHLSIISLDHVGWSPLQRYHGPQSDQLSMKLRLKPLCFESMLSTSTSIMIDKCETTRHLGENQREKQRETGSIAW